jgi:cardiolipin synthase
VTLPNFISTARGVFGPVLGVAYVTEAVSPEFVFAGVVVAAVSDWLDGYVARRMHLRSVSGTYLDPLGDKLFVASLAAALAAKGGVPIWLAGSIVARDVSLIAGAWIQRGRALEWRWDTWGQFFAGTRDARFGDAGGCAKERRAGGDGVDDGKKKSPKTLKPRLRNAPAVPPMRPELLGKVTTTAQFVLFGSALAHGISGGETPSKEVMETIFGVAGVATFASGASYFFRKDAFARNA